MKTHSNSVVLRNDGTDPSTLADDLNAGVSRLVTVRIASLPVAGQGVLASIFDINGNVITNPLTTDNNGNYTFKADVVVDVIIEEGVLDIIEPQIDLMDDIVSAVIPFDTLASAVNSTDLSDGDTIYLKERTTGNGGGAHWNVVLASSVTANTYDIVASLGGQIPALALVLTDSNNQVIRAWGAIGDGVADDILTLQARADRGGTILGDSGDEYLISTTLTMSVANTIFNLRKATIKQSTTWVSGSELVLLTAESSGVMNGTIKGNSAPTDVTNGIQGDFSGLGAPRSESVFSNLLIKDMGDSGLKINAGKGDRVTDIWCTNNHIATLQSSSGNVRFDSCDEVESSNVVIIESFGKGVTWSISNRCTHSGLIVDRASVDVTGGSTGVSTVFSNDVFISNVFCRNVTNKFSQFSNNINITNFKFLDTGATALRLQGATRCKLSQGEVVTTTNQRTCVISQHPDTGSGISNATNNKFTNVRFEGALETPLVLDGNTSGNSFLDCNVISTASDATAAVTDYVIIDSGLNNAFKECSVESKIGSGFGGFLHDGVGWTHTDCIVGVPLNPVNATADGFISGGKYTSTDGASDGVTSTASLNISNSEIVIDGSKAAVAALYIRAGGNRIKHTSINTITDTVAGYGIRFGTSIVEDTEITHCDVSGGNRSIKSIVQSTTNKLSFITTQGGGIDFGVNGGSNPGTPKLLAIDDDAVLNNYTPTNVNSDRAYDANATTTEELADVLGTLILDLQNKRIIG